VYLYTTLYTQMCVQCPILTFTQNYLEMYKRYGKMF